MGSRRSSRRASAVSRPREVSREPVARSRYARFARYSTTGAWRWSRHPCCCSPGARAIRSPSSSARAAARTTSPVTARSRVYAGRRARRADRVRGRDRRGRHATTRRMSRGRCTVVNFWYAGCAPCRVEAPILEEVSRAARRRRRELRRRERARPGGHRGVVRGRLRRDLPVDPRRRRRARCSSRSPGPCPPAAVPTTIVLDQEGRVAARVLGQLDRGVDPRLDHRRPARRAGAERATAAVGGIGEIVLNGQLLAADADRARRRARVVPVAVRAAARARVPRLPRRVHDASADAAEERRNRRRLLLGVLLFIAGFTLVFVTFNLRRRRRRGVAAAVRPT